METQTTPDLSQIPHYVENCILKGDINAAIFYLHQHKEQPYEEAKAYVYAILQTLGEEQDLPKHFGYCPNLPIKRGMTVTILKGTPVHHRGKIVPAGRTYKVTVHSMDEGSNACARHSRRDPKVIWPGTGGYWSEVDINLIPEANHNV
jgi:hypothetical protein